MNLSFAPGARQHKRRSLSKALDIFSHGRYSTRTLTSAMAAVCVGVIPNKLLITALYDAISFMSPRDWGGVSVK